MIFCLFLDVDVKLYDNYVCSYFPVNTRPALAHQMSLTTTARHDVQPEAASLATPTQATHATQPHNTDPSDADAADL